MGYKIIVSPNAEKNLQDAVDYYLKKAGKGIASNFLIDYRSIYKALQVNPFYQFHDTNYRFLPFNDFPYIAFFIVDENSRTVFLNAIFNTFQDPEKIQRK